MPGTYTITSPEQLDELAKRFDATKDPAERAAISAAFAAYVEEAERQYVPDAREVERARSWVARGLVPGCCVCP